MSHVDIRSDIFETGVIDKAISILQEIKGIEEAFVIDDFDRRKIAQLEIKDEKTSSSCFGRKENTGMKQVLRSDILLSFVTNKGYRWPENSLKIIHRGEVIGGDVSDANEIERFKRSHKHRVFGNIVIDRKKFNSIKGSINPPLVVIGARPCPQIEELFCVSEAIIASPSRLTDKYIRSKMDFKSKGYVGSFLVGFNFCHKNILLIQSKTELIENMIY